MRTYYCKIAETKRKREDSRSRTLTGSVHIALLGMLMMTFVGGGIYLYSVNKSAVQGYHMRTLEKEIGVLKQENENLRISEADARSLYRMETVREDLHMQKIEAPLFLEDTERESHDRSVALR